MAKKEPSKRREGCKHVQLWLSEPLSQRLDAVLSRIPYDISISSVGERAFTLAGEELERTLPE